MTKVLKKIPLRKILREKGKSLSVMAAVFFTTVLFVIVFSTLFFVKDAAEEMLRMSSPMLMDAIIHVSEEECERIRANPRAAETSMDVIVAGTPYSDPDGVGDMAFLEAEERMAWWMRYYPAQGRMPEKGNEIVVSDQYLRQQGLTYSEGMTVEMTFTYLNKEEFTEPFTVVGVYKRALQPIHAVLVSKDFYGKAYAYWEACGLDPKEEENLQVGILFSSRGNIRKQASLLIEESEVELEEGEIVLNDTSLLTGMGVDVWAALFGLILLVMWLGYLFISNIFHLSVIGDARFYGKLSVNGITKREIKKLIRRQNSLLFLAAAIPALFVGYLFSGAVLPEILSTFITIQVRKSGNIFIFVLALIFSYLTVWVSERKPIRLAKNASPIEMKKYMGRLKSVKSADNGDCMKKIRARHFRSDKAKVLKVCVAIAVSIFLANAFYAITAGFDTEAYVKENLDADYLVAKEPVFTSPGLNSVSYERTTDEEIAEYRELPGIEACGGASLSQICILPAEEEWDRFEQVWGEEEDTYEERGRMWTHAIGLDDMMVQKMTVIRGEIDLEEFRTGKYILLDPILSDDNPEHTACWEPGDRVTVPFRSGEEGTYTVMAVVEGLPDSLAFPGRYWGSNVYLPMEEWQEKEKANDYYLYAFDVEETFHEEWDAALSETMAAKNSGLAYRSAKSLVRQAENYIRGLKLAGFVLSAILLSMGVLNFINCMAESVYSRSRELAVLESMGIKQQEIERNLVREGLAYMAGGFVPGCLFAVFGVYALIVGGLQEPYIVYHFYLRLYLLFALLGGAVAVLAPLAAYRQMNRKEGFLYRIRAFSA